MVPVTVVVWGPLDDVFCGMQTPNNHPRYPIEPAPSLISHTTHITTTTTATTTTATTTATATATTTTTTLDSTDSSDPTPRDHNALEVPESLAAETRDKPTLQDPSAAEGPFLRGPSGPMFYLPSDRETSEHVDPVEATSLRCPDGREENDRSGCGRSRESGDPGAVDGCEGRPR